MNRVKKALSYTILTIILFTIFMYFSIYFIIGQPFEFVPFIVSIFMILGFISLPIYMFYDITFYELKKYKENNDE